jgi:hypothetical protein
VVGGRGEGKMSAGELGKSRKRGKWIAGKEGGREGGREGRRESQEIMSACGGTFFNGNYTRHIPHKRT